MKMYEIAKFQCLECRTLFHQKEKYPIKKCPKCNSTNTEKLGKIAC